MSSKFEREAHIPHSSQGREWVDTPGMQFLSGQLPTERKHPSPSREDVAGHTLLRSIAAQLGITVEQKLLQVWTEQINSESKANLEHVFGALSHQLRGVVGRTHNTSQLVDAIYELVCTTDRGINQRSVKPARPNVQVLLEEVDQTYGTDLQQQFVLTHSQYPDLWSETVYQDIESPLPDLSLSKTTPIYPNRPDNLSPIQNEILARGYILTAAMILGTEILEPSLEQNGQVVMGDVRIHNGRQTLIQFDGVVTPSKDNEIYRWLQSPHLGHPKFGPWEALEIKTKFGAQFISGSSIPRQPLRSHTRKLRHKLGLLILHANRFNTEFPFPDGVTFVYPHPFRPTIYLREELDYVFFWRWMEDLWGQLDQGIIVGQNNIRLAQELLEYLKKKTKSLHAIESSVDRLTREPIKSFNPEDYEQKSLF